MEETLISFDTAKLAKEKGFNEKCTHVYTIGFNSIKEDKNVRSFGNYENNSKLLQPVNLSKSQPHLALAPTQSLLQKWIREKPTPINVTPFTDFITWQVEIQHPDKGLAIIEKNKDGIWFDSYEEALEAGLIEALKLIP